MRLITIMRTNPVAQKLTFLSKITTDLFGYPKLPSQFQFYNVYRIVFLVSSLLATNVHKKTPIRKTRTFRLRV